MRDSLLKNFLIILLAVVGFANARDKQDPFVIPDSLRAVIADSLKRAIFELYPLEYLDSARVDSVFAKYLTTRAYRETFSESYICEQDEYTDAGSLTHTLQCGLCDPMAKLARTQVHDKLPVTATIEAESLRFGYERIVLKGRLDTEEAFALLDSTLEVYKDRPALLLDLRGATAEHLLSLCPLASRFIDRELDGIGLKTRIAGTSEHTLTTPHFAPASQSYVKPLGVLVNYNWDHIGFLIDMLRRRREWMPVDFVGARSCTLSGVEPVEVPLPYGLSAQIPTGTYVDWEGNNYTLNTGWCIGCEDVIFILEVLGPQIHPDDLVNNMIYSLHDVCKEYDQAKGQGK
jgi:hypothetical protein